MIKGDDIVGITCMGNYEYQWRRGHLSEKNDQEVRKSLRKPQPQK
jgi:hypothetical protein